MSLTEGLGGSSSPESSALGEVLAYFGTVADYAGGKPPEQGERVAAAAAGIAQFAGRTKDEIDALYFAARLRNLGALGNPALAKGEPLSERETMMQLWDVPAEGARICERIAALPPETADFVRWQAECWDGTGFPDQLRSSGIPVAAQILHIAATYTSYEDPEEALAVMTAEGGRRFAPEQIRAFVMWFHTFGGEVESVAPPYGALDAARSRPGEIIEMLSERIDVHNATPGRSKRIARLLEEVGRVSGFSADDLRRGTYAALLFGSGELRSQDVEGAQFDALARLGNQTRAEHAVIAARLTERCTFLADVAPVLRARAEWYDGTGGPDKLRHDAIPQPALALAAAIAYDAIEETYRSRISEERTLPATRLETAAGTQFDPRLVRALTDVVRTHA